MRLAQPAGYLRFDERDRGRLRYFWDDTQGVACLGDAPEWLVPAARALSVRARLALCVGLHDWLMWRFDGLHGDPRPALLSEAFWCATLDARYLRFFELDLDEWIGPVLAPLWCAATWLQPALAKGDEFPGEIDDAIELLARLGLHVLPDAAHFGAWLEAVVPHLGGRFPAAPDDPFEDLFGRRTAQRRGAPVGPDALDPWGPPCDPAAHRAALEGILAQALARPNPFVVPPDEWDDESDEEPHAGR